jgi:hypothetical protein
VRLIDPILTTSFALLSISRISQCSFYLGLFDHYFRISDVRDKQSASREHAVMRNLII